MRLVRLGWFCLIHAALLQYPLAKGHLTHSLMQYHRDMQKKGWVGGNETKDCTSNHLSKHYIDTVKSKWLCNIGSKVVHHTQSHSKQVPMQHQRILWQLTFRTARPSTRNQLMAYQNQGYIDHFHIHVMLLYLRCLHVLQIKKPWNKNVLNSKIGLTELLHIPYKLHRRKHLKTSKDNEKQHQQRVTDMHQPHCSVTIRGGESYLQEPTWSDNLY